MTAVVLVGAGHTPSPALAELAAAVGGSHAYLLGSEPSLRAELDRLAALGHSDIRLVYVPLTAGSPTRSWVRRVAAHWKRAHPGVQVRVSSGVVTGDEAPLHSPAWDAVPRHHTQLVVCRGPRCTARGADDTVAAVTAAISAAKLSDDDILLTTSGCLFPCNHAPVAVAHPHDAWFGPVTAADAPALIAELCTKTTSANRNLPCTPGTQSRET